MNRFALKVALAYLLIAIVSGILVDAVLAWLIEDPAAEEQAKAIKNVVFFFLTVAVLYLLVAHGSRRRRQVQEQFAAIIETAMDGIVVINQEGLITGWNEQAKTIFGWSAEEVRGRALAEIIVPSEYRQAHRQGLKRFLETGVSRILNRRIEMTALHRDGREFPVELAVSAIGRPGSDLSFSAFVRDITERKTTEERLKEQANLLDRAQDAIIVGDTEDRIQYWNRGAERIYGWKAAEALGKNAALLLFRQSAPEPEEANRVVLNQGDWLGEFQHVTKDGRDIIVESRWSLLRDSTGKPRGKLVINTDVTQRKKLESQFLRAQRLESIGTLAGGIAHDLNNVLTPVMMAGKLLQKPDRPEAERKHLFETLQASAERGAEMVRQLLAFAGGIEGQRSSLNLRHVVREVRSILEHTFIKSICIETNVPGDTWLVSGDATQMSQVLMNLCVNARDAMPQGGTLSIAAGNTILRDAALHPDARPGPYVLVTVADTGHGIPPDVIDKIFDPFFTTKEQGKGTGLGLSTVLGIVRSHGGFINVYSEVGKGTKFSVYLPAIDTAEIRPAKPEEAEPAQGNGELILVVDDEAFIRETARAALEAGGYQVVTAADGKEGVETFRRENGAIQAVVLDVMMPGMDGPATMRHLRELDPKVRIVAASGLRATGDAAVAIASGTRGFLQKPFTDEQLLRAVNRALNDVEESVISDQ